MVGTPSGGKISRLMRWIAKTEPRTTARTTTNTVNGRRRERETKFIRRKLALRKTENADDRATLCQFKLAVIFSFE